MPPIQISSQEKGNFNIIWYTFFTVDILNRIVGME